LLFIDSDCLNIDLFFVWSAWCVAQRQRKNTIKASHPIEDHNLVDHV